MKIILYPDPILRQKAAKITFQEKIDWKDIGEQMIKCCRENNGAGLAGPQVDISYSICVALIGYENFGVFINPKMSVTSNVPIISEYESCLSLPGVSTKVARPYAFSVYYTDLDQKNHMVKVNGMTARILAHEISHLQGRLIIDQTSKQNYKLIEPKIKELEESYNQLMNTPVETLPTT